MSGPIQFGIISFSSLFAMLNPISAAPIFLALTKGRESNRKSTAFKSCMTALVALVLFWGAGNSIFAFFGITVPAFKIVGGLIFLLSALKVMQSGEAVPEESAEGDPSVVPIGIPLIAGAGALSTVMVLGCQAKAPVDHLALGISIFANILVTFLVFMLAPKLLAKMKPSGHQVMGSVMNLLSAVIGVQFIIDGVTHVVKQMAA